MGMKPPMWEPPLTIKNGVNQRKHRDAHAAARNQGTVGHNAPDEPIPPSVIVKRYFKGMKAPRIS